VVPRPAQPDAERQSELQSALDAGGTLLLGSQTDYRRTQSRLEAARAAGAATVFVFDHWKNYAEHFGRHALPDVIVVPDMIAHEQFLAAVGSHGAPHLRVLPHPGIDAAAQRVAALGAQVRKGTIALLLDPTEPQDGLGYDWRGSLASALALAEARPASLLLVKPHPRQNVDAVKNEIAALSRNHRGAELYHGETESLISIAEEVWGMTTSALNVCARCGQADSKLPGRTQCERRTRLQPSYRTVCNRAMTLIQRWITK